jgi:hypothetical protein
VKRNCDVGGWKTRNIVLLIAGLLLFYGSVAVITDAQTSDALRKFAADHSVTDEDGSVRLTADGETLRVFGATTSELWNEDDCIKALALIAKDEEGRQFLGSTYEAGFRSIACGTSGTPHEIVNPKSLPPAAEIPEPLERKPTYRDNEDQNS